MSLLYELSHNYPVISVFSGTEADNPFYSRCIPKLFIHAKVSKRGLKQFINRQRLSIGLDSPLKDALLILDDCFDHPGALDNDMMRMGRASFPRKRGKKGCPEGAVQAGPTSTRIGVVYPAMGRQRDPEREREAYHVSSIHPPPLTSSSPPQYVVDLKPWARSTTSAIFLFHCPNARDRKLLYENYGCSAFQDYATFNHVYTFITSTPHTAMVILLNQGTQGVLQTVFWYRPQVNQERRQLCHPAVWNHARQRMDTNKLEHLALLSCCSADEK